LALPDFRWLWSGALVSLAGTHMQFVALPYFVHEQTGSSFATALAAAAQVLPGLTLGPVAGALADRRDSRRLLIGANLVLAAVTLGFCLALVGPWWVVIVVAFVQAVVAQLVAPAEIVLMPSLVPTVSLPAANSLSAVNNSLARLIGPAAGGLLYAAAGLPIVAVVNAASFAVAALLVGRINAQTSARAPAQTARPARRIRTFWLRLTGGWPAGWREIRNRPLLGRLLAFIVLTGLGEGCVSALLAPYVAEVFGSSTALGLILTCQAVGGVAGALIMSGRAVVDRLPQTLGVAAVICGVLLAVMIGYPVLYPQLWPTLVLVALAGLPFAAVAAAQTTLLQTLPNPAVRGSVFGVTVATAGAAQLVGILSAGYLADQLNVYVLLADAPCYLLAGLVIIRGRRRTPAQTPKS
jgi:MFS family permease